MGQREPQCCWWEEDSITKLRILRRGVKVLQVFSFEKQKHNITGNVDEKYIIIPEELVHHNSQKPYFKVFRMILEKGRKDSRYSSSNFLKANKYPVSRLHVFILISFPFPKTPAF